MKTTPIIKKGDTPKEKDVKLLNMVSLNPEKERSSTSPVSVVKPGAPQEGTHQAQAVIPSSKAGVRKLGEVEGRRNGLPSSLTPPPTGVAVGECANTWPATGASALPIPLYSAVDVWRQRHKKGVIDGHVLAGGREQMALLEQVIEKGARLRDRLVQSMMGDYQQQQQQHLSDQQQKTEWYVKCRL